MDPKTGDDLKDNSPSNDLVIAAGSGNLQAVNMLLETRRASATFANCKALRLAAAKGHLDVVERLVKAGADIHVHQDEALRKAAEGNHLAVARYLLRAGAHVDAVSGEALMTAVEQGSLPMVRLLLDFGANPASNGSLPFRQAVSDHGVYSDARAVVQSLLDAGADAFSILPPFLDFHAGNGAVDIVNDIRAHQEKHRVKFISQLEAAADKASFLLSGEGEAMGVMLAARMNALEHALCAMKAQGLHLTQDMILVQKDSFPRSIVEWAAEYGCAMRLFDPQLWKDGLAGATAAWDKVPPKLLENGKIKAEDFAALVAAHRQQALKTAAPRNRFKL